MTNRAEKALLQAHFFFGYVFRRLISTFDAFSLCIDNMLPPLAIIRFPLSFNFFPLSNWFISLFSFGIFTNWPFKGSFNKKHNTYKPIKDRNETTNNFHFFFHCLKALIFIILMLFALVYLIDCLTIFPKCSDTCIYFRMPWIILQMKNPIRQLFPHRLFCQCSFYLSQPKDIPREPGPVSKKSMTSS